MRHRSLTSILLTRASLALALVTLPVACGDDDGAGGSSGASGEGGDGGDAGSGGDSGQGGDGGDSGQGGDSGEGGDGGDAGTGGTSGDGGGGGDAGTGGDGGDAGTGGDGGDAGVMMLPTTTATAIVAGRSHGCAITTAGGVRCWGYGEYGQRGDGLLVADSRIAVEVEGLASGVTQISATMDHTCAIKAGALVCWGDNRQGQLGDDSTDSSGSPVDVEGLDEDVIAVAAGFEHTCAIVTGGTVKCWGQNEDGQLGNDSRDDSSVPVDVVGIANGATAIAAGRNHTCAIVSGGLKCWGSNDYGELGDGTTTLSQVPVDVSGLGSGVSGVSAGGDLTCAIVNGAAQCWGNNRHGEVGNGNGGLGMEVHTPAAVVNAAANVTSIAAGYEFSCAVVNGAAKCWGYNSGGTIGNGEALSYETDEAVQVNNLTSGVASVAVSSQRASALTASGNVFSWGDNLGVRPDAAMSYDNSPIGVPTLSP